MISKLMIVMAALAACCSPAIAKGQSCAMYNDPTNLTVDYIDEYPVGTHPEPYIQLRWTPDPTAQAHGIGYDIERSDDAGQHWHRLAFGYPNGHVWYSCGFVAGGYTFNIALGATYLFRVRVSDDNPGNVCQGNYIPSDQGVMYTVPITDPDPECSGS